VFEYSSRHVVVVARDMHAARALPMAARNEDSGVSSALGGSSEPTRVHDVTSRVLLSVSFTPEE
jgi:hypothetical protein